MARTNANAVKLLLGADYDCGDAQRPARNLQPYIDTANAIVSRVATCATLKSTPLSSGELELLERWLAAHYYQQSDQGYSARTTADASGTFHGQTGMGFESTKYGQSALGLDFSGCLMSIGKKRAAAIWLGKTQSEQIDYVDRG